MYRIYGARATLILLSCLLSVAYLKSHREAVRLMEQVGTLQRTVHDLHREYRQVVAREQAVREGLIRRDVGLPLVGPLSTEQLVLATRDYVYRRTIVAPDDHPYAPLDRYLWLSGADRIRQLCGGMAHTYAWMLESLGVPARTVQLATADFLAGREHYGTHITVEAWYGGKWHLSDPTFNCSWRASSADGISLAEAIAVVRGGGMLEPDYGPTVIAGRRWCDYDQTFADLLSAYLTSPTRIGTVNVPREQYPSPGWMQMALQRYAQPSR